VGSYPTDLGAYSVGVNSTLLRALGAVAALAAIIGAFFAGRTQGPSSSGSTPIDVQATPGVVTAIRDVAQLEATSYHVEKVVEASEAQSRLWGLVQASDVLLLVAVGDVVAGVDLGKVRDEDVRLDARAGALHIHLPAPEVTSSTLDDRATHVYSRKTDVLASRNERLEGEARLRAETAMRKEAIDTGILERARTSAERTLRALLGSLGYRQVEIEWTDRR
jgi:hypothetical protein